VNNGSIRRTPDERFIGLSGYTFAPRYLTIDDAKFGSLRMHRVDEGPADAPVVLMLHGEPTWSYLYRKMIPPVVAAGYRAVAPDYVGFGRSDKLADRDSYSYQAFVDWLCQFVEALDLRRITLVCQDWGGPIGLRVLSHMPHRFDGVLATNTLLPNFEPPPKGVAGWPGEQIEAWAKTCREARDLPLAEIVAGVCVERPDAEILRGYDAPFPDASYKAAALAITGCIPIRPDMPGVIENRRAWEVLERFTGPFLTAFSDRDPSTKAWEKVFQERVPGARGQPHVEVAGAGHFVQEEKGEDLAELLLGLLSRRYR
jgi:haloalkane dehalogenase